MNVFPSSSTSSRPAAIRSSSNNQNSPWLVLVRLVEMIVMRMTPVRAGSSYGLTARALVHA